MAAIVAEHVAKRFVSRGKEVLALDNVDLEVNEGEFVAFVGPSGCGKSTLLNMVAGIIAPSDGTIRHEGRVVDGINRHVGYMTQTDSLLPWRTVMDNVLLPLQLQGVGRQDARERAAAILEKVHLSGFADHFPVELSGGMRKRVAIAQVLVYDPGTLLMDEPFGALDAQLRLKMQIEIRRLAKALGKTAVFVTHDLDEAVALADRCVVFTHRPGTIARVVEVPLPPDRDLLGLRHNATYRDLTAELWDLLSPDMDRLDD